MKLKNKRISNKRFFNRIKNWKIRKQHNKKLLYPLIIMSLMLFAFLTILLIINFDPELIFQKTKIWDKHQGEFVLVYPDTKGSLLSILLFDDRVWTVWMGIYEKGIIFSNFTRVLFYIDILSVVIIYFYWYRGNDNKLWFKSKYNLYIILFILIIMNYCSISEMFYDEDDKFINISNLYNSLFNLSFKIVILTFYGMLLIACIWLWYNNFLFIYPAGPKQKHKAYKYLLWIYIVIKFLLVLVFYKIIFKVLRKIKNILFDDKDIRKKE